VERVEGVEPDDRVGLVGPDAEVRPDAGIRREHVRMEVGTLLQAVEPEVARPEDPVEGGGREDRPGKPAGDAMEELGGLGVEDEYHVGAGDGPRQRRVGAAPEHEVGIEGPRPANDRPALAGEVPEE